MEARSILQLSGTHAAVYVKRGATLIASGSAHDIYYEDIADVTTSASDATLVACEEIVFDASSVSGGCD